MSTYVLGASCGLAARSSVLRKRWAMAPSNSASDEMPESSQQSPTPPCLMSLGSISPHSFRPATSPTPSPRPGLAARHAWPCQLKASVYRSVAAPRCARGGSFWKSATMHLKPPRSETADGVKPLVPSRCSRVYRCCSWGQLAMSA